MILKSKTSRGVPYSKGMKINILFVGETAYKLKDTVPYNKLVRALPNWISSIIE